MTDGRSGGEKLWDAAMKLMVPVVIAIVGWGITLSVNVSNLQLVSMTKSDGHAMETRIMKNLAPEWLREDLREIKDLLKQQDERLRVLESKVK